MISLQIKLDVLKTDYPDFYKFFKDTLHNSQSPFKDRKEDKYKCFYYVGFYMFPSQKTEEYYENLYSLKYEDRIKEEYKKVKVTITMLSGKFVLSDQTSEVSEFVKPFIDEIISKKMYFEQMSDEEGPNDEILNSIPDLEDVIEKIEEEKNIGKNFLESIGIKMGAEVKEEKEIMPQDMLNKLISDEKYEEADEFIKEHPNLKKRDE